MAIVVAARGRHRWMNRLIGATMHTSGQYAVRLVMVVLGGLVALSLTLGLDLLLGAFAAGVLVRLLLASASPDDSRVVKSKLEGVGFGFLVPIFFVQTGIAFDLDALLADHRSLALVPVFLIALLVVRGLPGQLSAPRGAPWRERIGVSLCAATALPILVAITRLAVAQHAMSTSLAAAMVGAGLLSVLVFPAIALGRRPPDHRPMQRPAGDPDAVPEQA